MHSHVNEPSVLVQDASSLQLWLPSKHSLISKETENRGRYWSLAAHYRGDHCCEHHPVTLLHNTYTQGENASIGIYLSKNRFMHITICTVRYAVPECMIYGGRTLFPKAVFPKALFGACTVKILIMSLFIWQYRIQAEQCNPNYLSSSLHCQSIPCCIDSCMTRLCLNNDRCRYSCESRYCIRSCLHHRTIFLNILNRSGAQQ